MPGPASAWGGPGGTGEGVRTQVLAPWEEVPSKSRLRWVQSESSTGRAWAPRGSRGQRRGAGRPAHIRVRGDAGVQASEAPRARGRPRGAESPGLPTRRPGRGSPRRARQAPARPVACGTQDGPRAGAAAWKRGWHLLAGGYARATAGVQPAGSCLPPVLRRRAVGPPAPGPARPGPGPGAWARDPSVGWRHPSRHGVPKAAGWLFELDPGPWLRPVPHAGPGFRVGQRPTCIQPKVPKPPR